MKFKNRLTFLMIFISSNLYVTHTHAQSQSFYQEKKLKISSNAEIGLASKNSSFNYALGFNIEVQYALSRELAALSSIGYSRLLTKDTSPIPDYDFLPILVGIKVFPLERIYFITNVGTGIPIQNGSVRSFIFGGGVGYQINRIDLSIMFNSYKQHKKSFNYHANNGMFTLRLGYDL